MTRDIKRVDELEVGDTIIIPGGKGTFTVSHIEKVGFREYRIICQGIRQAFFYYDNVEVPYLGNNNKEETMTTPKVDCSVLYPYFDVLATEEATFKHTNLLVYVRQQLKHIHELFEGVLELTLEEVKTLYFERKMSKEEVKHKSKTKLKTKKAKDLQLRDKVVIPNLGDVFEVSAIQNDYSSSKIELFLRPSSPELDSYDKEQEFIIVD